jgi:hypothetical protein
VTGGPDEIPVAVRELLQRDIDSVEQLEVLLLLHDRPERDWTADEVSAELRTNGLSTAARLDDLTARGLIEEVARPGAFRYGPRTAAQRRAVDGLAREYATRRVTVITLIFAKPIDRVRSFADAFRLRRDPDG